MVVTTVPKLWKPREVADLIGVCEGTLSVWRSTKRYDLQYIKCGHLVRYREQDVADFLERRRVTPKPTAKKR